jgi:hypothetical protein
MWTLLAHGPYFEQRDMKRFSQPEDFSNSLKRIPEQPFSTEGTEAFEKEWPLWVGGTSYTYFCPQRAWGRFNEYGKFDL